MEQLYKSINLLTEPYLRGGLTTFLFTIAIMWLSTWILLLITRRVLNNFLIRNKLDEIHFKFIHRILNTFIYTLLGFGISIQIIPINELALSILASSGVAVLILGFAAQEAFSNIISGFFISFFRPFTVGHLVHLPNENITGTIEDITLRHTVIKTGDNNRVIVPNSVINKAIIENRDIIDKTACRTLTLSIAYDSDLERAKKIMMDEALKNELLIDHRTKKDIKEEVPQLKVLVSNLTNGAIELKMAVWTKNNSDAISLLAELRENIKKSFDSEGIEIPYPYQNIIIKK